MRQEQLAFDIAGLSVSLLVCLAGITSAEKTQAKDQPHEAATPVLFHAEPAAVQPAISLDVAIEGARRSLAEEPGDRSMKFLLARWLYLRGASSKDHDADNQEAMSLFADLSGTYAGTREAPLYNAYHGSTMLVKSSRTWMFWEKGKLAERGGELIDGAVEATNAVLGEQTDGSTSALPLAVETRYVRAISTHHLPDWMGRAEQSREDFAWVVEQLDAVSVTDRAALLMPRLAASAYATHGDHLAEAGRTDEARLARQKAAKACPDCPAGQRAAERLKKSQ